MLNKDIKKILFFGGTFDPVHLGHTRLLKEGIRKIKPDITLVMPNKCPPLKDNETLATTHDRMEMLKIAFKNIPNLIISDREIRDNTNEPSYTYLTILWLRKKYPNAKIYLLVGYDRLKDIKYWKNYKFILAYTTLVAGIRASNQEIPESKDYIILNYKPLEISGTKLREWLEPKYLDSNVLKYIRQHYLYLSAQIRPLMNEHRYQHTLRVRDVALKIADSNHYEFWNKVIAAAMYHDICKQWSEKEILKVCKQYDKHIYPTWHTLHGLAASIVIQDKFYVRDREIINAVKNHVIPNGNIDRLSKIIYLADKLEPNRTEQDIPNRKKYLKLACKNLDKAFDEVFKLTQEKY